MQTVRGSLTKFTSNVLGDASSRVSSLPRVWRRSNTACVPLFDQSLIPSWGASSEVASTCHDQVRPCVFNAIAASFCSFRFFQQFLYREETISHQDSPRRDQSPDTPEPALSQIDPYPSVPSGWGPSWLFLKISASALHVSYDSKPATVCKAVKFHRHPEEIHLDAGSLQVGLPLRRSHFGRSCRCVCALREQSVAKMVPNFARVIHRSLLHCAIELIRISHVASYRLDISCHITRDLPWCSWVSTWRVGSYHQHPHSYIGEMRTSKAQ